jgi:hypothetical protein
MQLRSPFVLSSLSSATQQHLPEDQANSFEVLSNPYSLRECSVPCVLKSLEHKITSRDERNELKGKPTYLILLLLRYRFVNYVLQNTPLFRFIIPNIMYMYILRYILLF